MQKTKSDKTQDGLQQNPYSVSVFATLGITIDMVAEVLKMDKYKKHYYKTGRDISIEDFFKVIAHYGLKAEFVKIGQKLIFVDKEITA